MTGSVFGHGDLTKPDPQGNYSHGPDPYIRSAACRGEDAPCGDGDGQQVSDHCCCCDPCRHAFQNVCDKNCCRCIPKFICLIFTPDAGQGTVYNCKAKSWKLFAEDLLAHGDVPNRRMYQTGIPDVGKVVISVGTLETDESVCTWRLEVPDRGIYEETVIDHRGAVHCLAPPTFHIPDVNITSTDPFGVVHDCHGSISSAAYVQRKVPFRRRTDDYGKTELSEVACGACVEVCNVLCVKRNDATEESGFSRVEFGYSDGKWTSDDDDYFTLVEVDGSCYLHLDGMDIGDLSGSLMEINPEQCSLGMNLSAKSGPDWIKISCNQCQCWDYICGTCRCACHTLCVLRATNGALTKEVLQWDPTQLWWGDDESHIDLLPDDDGDCVAAALDFKQPARVNNDCGEGIIFAMADDPSDQILGGYQKSLWAWCVGCTGDCEDGTCLEACDNVAQVIYATVTGKYNRVEGEGEVEIVCMGPAEIAMGLVFVGNEAAGEWRWVGAGPITCTETGDTKLMSINISCDGLGTWSVAGVGGTECTGTFEVDIPCGNLWDQEVESEQACPCCTPIDAVDSRFNFLLTE